MNVDGLIISGTVMFISGSMIKLIEKKLKLEKNKNKIAIINIQETKEKLVEKLKNLSYEELKEPMYCRKNEEQMKEYIRKMKSMKTKNPDIYNFYTELKKKIPFSNLENILTRSVTLKIERKPFKKRTNCAGEYSKYNNKIIIYLDTKDVLYHELLHVSSTPSSYENIIGFHYSSKDIGELGKGLNEGYTEILNKRFFNNNNNVYYYHQKLTLLIEKFYDNKNTMQDDYFNGNIFNVIRTLLKSMSLEEAIDIIVDMDNLNSNDDLYATNYYKIRRKIEKAYKKSR